MAEAIVEVCGIHACTGSEYMIVVVGIMAAGGQTWCWSSSWALTSWASSMKQRAKWEWYGLLNLRAHPQWHTSSKKTTPPSPSQTVHLLGGHIQTCGPVTILIQIATLLQQSASCDIWMFFCTHRYMRKWAQSSPVASPLQLRGRRVASVYWCFGWCLCSSPRMSVLFLSLHRKV